MSDDEVFALLVSAALGGWTAFSWYMRLSIANLAPYAGHWRGWLGVAPVFSLAGVLVVLVSIAAQDVRSDSKYILLYLVLGAAWVFVAVRVMSLFGISFRDDALERRNPAAAIAVICTMVAHAAIYSGANVGDGPGWWCVIIAGLIGATAWFLLWAIVESACKASEQVTVERDVATAIRLGGYMIASGLICARGVAGDWVSVGDTIAEFRDAWPVAPLAVVAIGVEFLLRSRSDMRRSLAFSVPVALAYVAIAIVAIAASPPLSSNPAYPAPLPQ